MAPTAPTFIEALTGGIQTFFSVWQFCIMQITPFFLAFFCGTYLLAGKKDGGSAFLTMLLTGIGLTAGFSIIFSLVSAPGVRVGFLLLHNLRNLKFVAGVFIISVGFLMILFSFIGKFNFKAQILTLISPLVGASFAVGYSPCIPPILSRILNYTSMSGNNYRGVSLLFLYSSGLLASATIVGSALILLLKPLVSGKRRREPKVYPVIAALIFMTMGVLLVTGFMIRFKALLVNLI